MTPRPSHFLLLCLLLWAAAPASAPAAGANAGTKKPGELSEAARWLQGYLKIDTSNPPGNEQRTAAYLAAILQQEGIPSRQVSTPEGRTSLWARLSAPGSGGRAVLLLHHMDVVAPGPGWTVPPFAGLHKDGVLWGRGAVDDKSLGIAYLAAFVDLKRRHLPLARDVIFLAVPDEESGGFQGTGWLLAKHPELFQGTEAVLGEGGRTQISGNKLMWWGIEVAQKRPLWLEVTASGRGGHASGLNPESANHTLIQALSRLVAQPPRWRVSAAARDYAHALAPLHGQPWRRIFTDIDKVIAENGPKEFLMPGMANLFLDTVQVTVLSGGERINVIPASSLARLDIRLLPDTDGEAFLAGVRHTLGPDCDVKVLVTAAPAPPSAPSGRMYAALQKVLGAEAPVVPTFVPGFTDSRFFRERHVAAYGVSPFALTGDDTRGIHNTDERISVSQFDRGVERMRRILAAYAGPPAH
jgi:acetylornithine deacetylase/succinyl-diaminopimelate desuccinylase-like protein